MVYEGHEFYRVSLGSLGRSGVNAYNTCMAKGMLPLCGYNNSNAFCVSLGRGKLPEYGDWAQGNVATLIGVPAMKDFLKGALVYGNNWWDGTAQANNLLYVSGNSLGDWNYPTQTGGEVVCVKPQSGYSWRTSGLSVCDNTSCGKQPYTLTQSVTCKSAAGQTGAEAQCAGTKPSPTLACTGNPGCSYIWKTENFPPCPNYCGQPASTVTRWAGCFPSTGSQASASPDNMCSGAGPKPATTQACAATAACASAPKDVVFNNMTFRKVNLGTAARTAANAKAACATVQMQPFCNYPGAQMNHTGCKQWLPQGADQWFEWAYPSNWAKVSGMPQDLKDVMTNSQFYGNNGMYSEASNLLTNEGGSVNWARNDRTGGDVVCVK